MLDRIIKIMGEIVKANSYDSIREKLSLVERELILDLIVNNDSRLGYCSLSICLNLFSEEEAISLFEVSDIGQKNILLLNLSDSEIVERVNFDFFDLEFIVGLFSKSILEQEKILDKFFKLDMKSEKKIIDGYAITNILSSYDDDNKLKIIIKFFSLASVTDDELLTSFRLNKFIEQFEKNNKMKVIDMFFEFEKENNNKHLSCYFITDVMSGFEEGNRLIILDKFIERVKESSNILVNGARIAYIIKLFSEDKKVDVLKKFIELNEVKNGGIIEIFDLCEILKVFDEGRLEALKLLIRNGVVEEDKWLWVEIFRLFSDEEKDEVMGEFIEYDKDKKIINEELIAGILSTYDNSKKLEGFQKLVINNNNISDLKVIGYYEDLKTKFDFFDFEAKQYLLSNVDKKKEVFKNIASYINCLWGDLPKGNIIYSDLISMYAIEVGLKRDNLLKFIQRFGYGVLKYVDNKNIIDAVNLDIESLENLIDIFDEKCTVLDNDVLNTICNSILQREFILNNEEDYYIFSTLIELLNKKDDNSLIMVKNRIFMISKVINLGEVLKKYDLTVENFCSKLLSGSKEMVDILHNITNLYIMKKRELYVNKRLENINEELYLDKKYEKNFIKKKYIATTAVEIIKRNILGYVPKENLDLLQLELINNARILDNIILFKKSPREYKLNSEYKQYLSSFDDLLNIMYELDKLEDPTNDPNAKYVYSAKGIDNDYLLSIIAELDIKQVDRFLLSNDSLLMELKNIFNKYKILGWGKTFMPLEMNADFVFDETTLAGIIGYFYKISMDLKKEGFSLTKLIALGNCYSSSSLKYSLLFGSDDYRLLSTNAGKNKSTMPRHRRLNLAVEYVRDMYERKFVSVFPLDINIRLLNGKLINAVVGNVTNMRNLTLGERTDSCLRIGGAFDDLFDFCLKDDNGFHIWYEDPQTGQFISRVSGIRNGNTVFLNELRNSELAGFDDSDCVEATKQVSSLLVDKTKDDMYPIENIVITSDYAMSLCSDDVFELEIGDRNEVLYGLSFNFDGDFDGIVLASAFEDNLLVEPNLGRNLVERYSVQRDKIRKYMDKSDAVKRVVQLQIINELLNGKILDEIEVDFDQDVIKCVSGEDWYISVDSRGDIKQFVLERSKNKEKAYEEMQCFLINLKDNFGNDLKKGVQR